MSDILNLTLYACHIQYEHATIFLLIEAALIGAVQNVYIYRYKLGACAYSGNWYRNSKVCFQVLKG